MPIPRASSFVVALSTLVALVTVSAVLSQLTPADRAGAVLPAAPITVDATDATLDTLAADSASAHPESDTADDAGTPTAADGPAPVAPAPAETVGAEPPSSEPEPTTPPAPEPSAPTQNPPPGQSANAPGQGGSSPGNSGNAPSRDD